MTTFLIRGTAVTLPELTLILRKAARHFFNISWNAYKNGTLSAILTSAGIFCPAARKGENKLSKIGDYFASQCGNPHGLTGKIMTWCMNRVNRIMYNGIVDELKLSENSKLLDVGFGNGYLEKLIFKKSKCFITGIDISDDMVEKASSLNRKYVDSGRMKFQSGDCCALDFQNGSFDVVTTMNTIYFWSDTEKGMSEICRVLKKDGIFINAVISKEGLDKFLYTRNGFKKFTKDEYIEFGRRAGFKKVRIKKLRKKYCFIIIYKK